MAILSKHGVSNASHGLIRHYSRTAAMEGVDHIAHLLGGAAGKYVDTRIRISMLQLHTQITADSTPGRFIDPSYAFAKMLQGRIVIFHMLTSNSRKFTRTIMPQSK